MKKQDPLLYWSKRHHEAVMQPATPAHIVALYKRKHDEAWDKAKRECENVIEQAQQLIDERR